MTQPVSARRRIEQCLANSACEANVLSAAHGVPMAAVAKAMGLDVDSGLSPYAIRAGVNFEKKLFEDDAKRLRDGLVKARLLPEGSSGLLDLRLRKQGGSAADLAEAAAGFQRFLALAADPGATLPTLIAGPAVRLPGGLAAGDALLAVDVLVVEREAETGRVLLVLGEIKSYPDRGGHTDRAALASARAQMGLYLHVLRHAVRALGGAVDVKSDGFLVLRQVKSNFPSVRYPEDLHWQAARARLALERFDAATAVSLPAGHGAADARKRLEVIEAAPKSFCEGCMRFCELARHCYRQAVDQADPVALGEDVARLLAGVDLRRVEELLRGASPANDTEQALLVQLAAAALLPETAP
jgi:hypothetical protein